MVGDDSRDKPCALLSVRGLGKRYATTVLDGVNLEVRAGEVHVLLGANGAGKSTLAKIISGMVQPTTGAMSLVGRAYAPDSKSAAEQQRVHIVQQELNLIGPLSVAENLFLNRLHSRFGFVRFRDMLVAAREALALVDLDDVDPAIPVEQLGIGKQQLIEIAAALSRRCRVLILDEPTAALTDPQVDRLFEHIERLKKIGVGIIYISHRMEEIRRIADRATILRDGLVVGTRDVQDLDVDDVVRMMVGEDVVSEGHSRQNQPGDFALRVEKLCAGRMVQEISFDVRRGEILGIAGLVGSGRTELLRAIFGADEVESGGLYMSNASRPVRFRQPRDAVRAGLAMVPEDRKHDGLLLSQSVRMNTTLGAMSQISNSLGWIDRSGERTKAERSMATTEVRCHSIEQSVSELSGGNQQKVVIGRWLMRGADVFLFDEPTRGIDVAAKATVYHLLNQLATEGKAIVTVSSDLEELMAICDRIAVMAMGKMVAVFSRGEWTQGKIMAAAIAGKKSGGDTIQGTIH